MLDLCVEGFEAYGALETFARYCSKIEVLKLKRAFDLAPPKFPYRPRVMLPELRVLELGGFAEREETKQATCFPGLLTNWTNRYVYRQQHICATILWVSTHLPKTETLRIFVRSDMFNLISPWLPTVEPPYSTWEGRWRRTAILRPPISNPKRRY